MIELVGKSKFAATNFTRTQWLDGTFGRITLRFIENGVPQAKAFVGRWLISPDEPWRSDDWNRDLQNLAVAITAKDNIVVFTFDDAPEDEEFYKGYLKVYGSFEQARQNHASEVIAVAMRRRGIVVQELDI